MRTRPAAIANAELLPRADEAFVAGDHRGTSISLFWRARPMAALRSRIEFRWHTT
jgi:hypothetical protein